MEKSIIQKMIEAEIITEKDIVEYYNTNLREQEENKPKKVEKPTYSLIADGVLVKFDEKDLNKNGGYVVPAGVHTIGKEAFARCQKLRKVKLGRDVIEIRDEAFEECLHLHTVKMSNSVRKIGERAFYICCDLININLSSNLKEIRDRTFARCSSLEQIEIPEKLEKIGYEAFVWCKNLSTINIPPANLTYVSENAFNCTPIGNDFMRKYYEMQVLTDLDKKGYEK